MENAKVCVTWLLLLASLACGFPAGAEPKTGDGGVAIKKAQGLIRQLSQEKTALEAEKANWQKEKTELENKQKSLEQTVRSLQPLVGEVERYKQSLEMQRSTLESQLGQERQRQQALLQKHNEVVGKANSIYADNQLLVQAVKEREQWMTQCSTQNLELRKVNLDVVSKYKEKGLFQQIVELEPITGIGHVETETTAEDYRYKLQQLKITPFKAIDKAADNKAVSVIKQPQPLPEPRADTEAVNETANSANPEAEPASQTGEVPEAKR